MAIKINPAHAGLLHKDLGVPEGKKIPAKKLAKAAKSKNPAVKKRAVFAQNAKKWVHSAVACDSRKEHNMMLADHTGVGSKERTSDGK